MHWVILLIIGLASLALVIAGLVYVGLKAWRLAKSGARVSRDVAPLADQLGRQTAVLAAGAERLAASGDELTATVARLQMSIARLQVVAQAFLDALAPYGRSRRYLAGD